MQNIVKTAEAAGFNTLVAAVKAANLTDTLENKGPFTVFAPTDEAFGNALKALGMTADQLLGNTDLLTKVLTYHVVAGKVMAADVMKMADGTKVKSVQGGEITISNSNGVKVNDANVIKTDVETTNGVIHVIDKVIMPA